MDVKTYSVFKMICNLKAHGLWSHAKDWMTNNGDYYDLFIAAGTWTSDNPMFHELLAKVQAELGVSGDLVNEILEASLADEQ